MSSFTKKTLPNGVRLLMEPMNTVRSATIGLWLDSGSRCERPEENGITHVIEHMFFKGTSRLDAFQINDAMNHLGGHFNAFTSQEALCLHARLIDEQVSEGLDLLAEVLLDSTFPVEELERERNVILEEQKMIEDTPDDLVVDLYHEALWGNDSVGQPIIGRPETVASFQRDDLMQFKRREFIPERLIVSIAGAFDRKAIESQARRLFSALEAGHSSAAVHAPSFAGKDLRRIKDVEQTQFCFGTLAPSRLDENRYAYAILNNILGGGMSSRFFREVREKRGLAYSIGSFVMSFRDTGAFAVSGGAMPQNLKKVIDLCRREIKSVYRDGVSEDELAMAKQQLRASILFSLESTGSRMSQLAEQEMYLGRYVPVDEILREVDGITTSRVQETAIKFFEKQPVAMAYVGPDGDMVHMKSL